MSRPSTGIKKINGVELSLIHASSGIDLLDEVVSEGGLEEMANDSGHGLQSLGSLGESLPVTIVKMKGGVMIEEMEVLPIMRNLKLAVEVGNIVGLSCDGQKGCRWIV